MGIRVVEFANFPDSLSIFTIANPAGGRLVEIGILSEISFL